MADNLKKLREDLRAANESKKGKGIIDVEDIKSKLGLSKPKNEDMSNRITESSYKGKNVTPDKPKKSNKLKDTSGDYWSADGLSGDIGAASGETGPNMGQVNKGGYDASEGMKRGGKAKCMSGGGSASSRGDGCAVRGKTKGRFV